MVTLRIQHRVPDYDDWKRLFDSDPMGRKASGVTSYRVARPVGDEHLALVDLEFDTVDAAEQMLARLRELWSGPAGAVLTEVQALVTETVESVSL